MVVTTRMVVEVVWAVVEEALHLLLLLEDVDEGEGGELLLRQSPEVHLPHPTTMVRSQIYTSARLTDSVILLDFDMPPPPPPAPAARQRVAQAPPPPAPSPPRQPPPPSFDGPRPNCDCNVPATERTVQKEGPNQGKKFWRCGDNTKDCDFFAWVDAVNGVGNRVIPAKRKVGFVYTTTPQCMLTPNLFSSRKQIDR